MVRKRAYIIVSAIFILLFAAAAFRVFQLSVLQHDELSARASAQRIRSFDYYQYSRGDILDAYGRKLVNNEEICLVVVPAMIKDDAATAAALAEVLLLENDIVLQKLQNAINQSIAPIVLKTGISTEQSIAIEELNIAGVLCVTLAARYDAARTASHLVGYALPTGENGAYEGASGLEKQYEHILAGRSDLQVVAEVDGLGNLSQDNLLVQASGSTQYNNLHLTIDRDYQQIVELVFERLGYSGACVIMQPNNGDILAMVSAPDFDAYFWEKPTSDSAYINKALMLYPPASTAKVVLALAALSSSSAADATDAKEEGNATSNETTDTIETSADATEDTADEIDKMLDEAADVTSTSAADSYIFLDKTFFCNGSYSMAGGHTVTCSKEEGHGELNIKKALAVSCNCYFVHLSEELGTEQLRLWIDRLGLTNLKIIGYDTPNYSKESFLSFSDSIEGDLANVSLGEQGINLCAVQEAVMISACVNGGYLVQPRLVKKITDQSGKLLSQYANEQPLKIIDSAVCEQIRQMLIETVSSGTAVAAQGKKVAAGGKTGSSESGAVWFSGFAPAEQAKIVVAVYVENGTAGGVEAAAVFKQVIDAISDLESW